MKRWAILATFFFDTGRFTGYVTQVEQAGTTNFTSFYDGNAADERRVNRDDTLNPNTVRYFTNGESFGQTFATTLDNHALEVLDTLFGTLDDFIRNDYGIAAFEIGQIVLF